MDNNPYQPPPAVTSIESSIESADEAGGGGLPGWYKWLSAGLGAGMIFVGTAMATFVVGFIVVVMTDNAGPVRELGEVTSARMRPSYYLFAVSIGVGLFMAVRSVLHTLRLFGANEQPDQRRST